MAPAIRRRAAPSESPQPAASGTVPRLAAPLATRLLPERPIAICYPTPAPRSRTVGQGRAPVAAEMAPPSRHAGYYVMTAYNLTGIASLLRPTPA